jgi:hypothetical protein
MSAHAGNRLCKKRDRNYSITPSKIAISLSNGRQRKFMGSHSRRFPLNIPFSRRLSDIACAPGSRAFSTRPISSLFTSAVQRSRGATLTRSFIRKRGRALIGHSAVRTQLTWCQKEGVPRAIITHCGSEIVAGDERKLSAKLRAIAAERGVDVRIAYDGMKLIL